MQRSKFPYSARSSAKVIRHAVSIDERRAKFRQDLISGPSQERNHQHHHKRHHDKNKADKQEDDEKREFRPETAPRPIERFRRPSQVRPSRDMRKSQHPRLSAHEEEEEGRLVPRISSPGHDRLRSTSPAYPHDGDASSIRTDTSQLSAAPPRPPEDEDDIDEAAEQNIEELWFPGCHADLGGGWPLSANEETSLSHNPLVWMVREAQKAGLEFDREMMIRLKCCDEDFDNWPESYDSTHMGEGDVNIPEVQVTGSARNLFGSPKSEIPNPGWAPGMEPEEPKKSEFHRTLHTAATKGKLHDCLEYNNGLSATSVISWKMMEWLPFRRMDLRPDGSWVAISFP